MVTCTQKVYSQCPMLLKLHICMVDKRKFVKQNFVGSFRFYVLYIMHTSYVLLTQILMDKGA
jgi:hypothetical protein